MSASYDIAKARAALGQAIRDVREQQGQSISELAAASGRSERTITRVEAGERETDYKMLLALADGLGVRASVFIGRMESLESGL